MPSDIQHPNPVVVRFVDGPGNGTIQEMTQLHSTISVNKPVDSPREAFKNSGSGLVPVRMHIYKLLLQRRDGKLRHWERPGEPRIYHYMQHPTTGFSIRLVGIMGWDIKRILFRDSLSLDYGWSHKWGDSLVDFPPCDLIDPEPIAGIYYFKPVK